jgi:hypothetical protein
VADQSAQEHLGGLSRTIAAFCRVCGYESDSPSWGEDGRTPSFEICPCCGVEWGYEDSLREGVLAHREAWFADGAKWTHEDVLHDGLTIEERLARVPPEFR